MNGRMDVVDHDGEICWAVYEHDGRYSLVSTHPDYMHMNTLTDEEKQRVIETTLYAIRQMGKVVHG